MTTPDPKPAIASPEEWRDARIALLAQEKEATRQRDRVNAARRRLPMVKVEKDYAFEGPDGPLRLLDLFDGQRQLIIYHFMFDPEWDEGCMGCTGYVDAIGDLSMLAERNTRFTLVSRAPLAKLEPYRAKRGWTLPWISSFGSDFNYDFHVTLDARVRPLEYNYQMLPEEDRPVRGEAQGLSVFFRDGETVYHTYSTYARGVESLTDSYALLDVTPYGRQEDWEDSPSGWPQRPTYG